MDIDIVRKTSSRRDLTIFLWYGGLERVSKECDGGNYLNDHLAIISDHWHLRGSRKLVISKALSNKQCTQLETTVTCDNPLVFKATCP